MDGIVTGDLAIAHDRPRARPHTWSTGLLNGVTRAVRLACRGQEPALALAIAAGLGFDRTWYVWTAGAPWISPAFQGIAIGPSVVAIALLAGSAWLIPLPGAAATDPAGVRWLVGFGAVLLVCIGLSVVAARAPLLALARFAEIALGLGACLGIARRPRLARWLVVGCCVVILVELPLVVLQEATQSTYPYQALLYAASNDLSAAAPGANVAFAASGARWQRAMGSFLHPNALGGFLALSLVLTLPWLVRRPRGAWKSSQIRRAVLLAVWIVGWIELAVSFSRTALLAALIGIIVYGASQRRLGLSRRTLSVLLAAIPAGVGALALAGPVLLNWMVPRPSLLVEQSVTQRVLIDRVAIELIRAHPLLGVGAGNFSLALLDPPFNAIAVDPAHAVPLLVAAEAGVVAGCAWLCLVVVVPLAAWRRHHDLQLVGRPAAIALVLLTLGALDHYLWSLAIGRALFWIALGIAAADESAEPDVGEAPA